MSRTQHSRTDHVTEIRTNHPRAATAQAVQSPSDTAGNTTEAPAWVVSAAAACRPFRYSASISWRWNGFSQGVFRAVQGIPLFPAGPPSSHDVRRLTRSAWSTITPQTRPCYCDYAGEMERLSWMVDGCAVSRRQDGARGKNRPAVNYGRPPERDQFGGACVGRRSGPHKRTGNAVNIRAPAGMSSRYLSLSRLTVISRPSRWSNR